MINVTFVGGYDGVIMVNHIVAYEDEGSKAIRVLLTNGDWIGVRSSLQDFNVAVLAQYKLTFIRVTGHL